MTSAKEAFPGVEGFGASYDRESGSWILYTMPDCQRIGTVDGFDKRRIGWVLNVMRSAYRAEQVIDTSSEC